MKAACYCASPFGPIGIAEENGRITNVFFGGGVARGTVQPGAFEERETALLQTAAAQLGEYFAGTRRDFSLPLAPAGTPFQQSVWAALRAIPCGETRTYAQLAAAIGRAGAVRAVGNANGRNPISIFIPCHRLIGSNGSLTGYAGGLAMKRALLALEGASYKSHV